MSALPPGTRIGPYEIVSALGAGGMGEVYRARDERLDRHVAIKILPASLATDPDRVTRFRREGRALAALSHPNIAGIHGVEESNGLVAIVMELVDGEDLSARIARGAVPVNEALGIARQVAEALEAAHQQGIIHRDLKPANVKVRSDGTVKLLDFGLAKVLDASGGSTPGVSQSPTITSEPMTHAGVMLGTAAYMSPEQARGKTLDRRTDIWSFGCLLYEMLAGRRAFPGDHPSDAVAAILTAQPDPGALPASTPPAIRRLLRRCLQKDPNDRLRDIGDARLEIRDAETGVDAGPEAVDPRERRTGLRERLAWAIAAALLVAVATLLLWPRPVAPEMRVNIVTPPTPSPNAVAISPDGRRIVFAGSSGEESRLWLRALDEDTARELEGTEGADAPFWSPDSRTIAFFADGRLKRIDVDGGSVRALANATNGTDGTWGRQNDILFASRGKPILRVSADGGEPAVVKGVVPGSNFSPHFLPDGRRFLYFHRGSPEVGGIYVAELDGTPQPQRLVSADTGAVYAPTGHLLFVLRDTLFAHRFDVGRLALAGEPVALARGVAAHLAYSASVSVSAAGTIVYRGMSAPGHRQLAWFDRSGKELERLGSPGETFSQPSLSHDEEEVIFYRALANNVDVWRMDARRGTQRRLTSHPADDVTPVWSPDRRRIVFSSNRSGVLDLYVKSLDSGNEELLLSTATFAIPTDWSYDGRFLLFTTENARGSLDIHALDLEGERRPFPVVETADFAEQGGQFSPDGRWIAYQSNESGRPEIYVQSFPSAGEKLEISTTGGSQVRWRRDGHELFYVARNGDLMAVPIQLPASGRPVVGTPVRLFALPIGSAIQLREARHQYMVSGGGQRVLVATVTPPPPAPLSLILNWKPRP